MTEESKEIYRSAWDHNAAVFKMLDSSLQAALSSGMRVSTIRCDLDVLTEIVGTFRHCRDLEASNPEFSWYWKGE